MRPGRRLGSYAALFDPKWKGHGALEDNFTTTGQKTALYLPGLLGAASLSAIVSLNETIRTSLVQGPLNTVQAYIWTTYLQVGLSPALHALMSLLIGLTLALVAMLLVGKGRRAKVVAG